jgi:cytochrome P450
VRERVTNHWLTIDFLSIRKAFLDMARIQANAATLVVGGSETTAALLSGVTYLLLKNPEAMKKLADEVRSSFQSEDEITLTSVSKLRYMLACLDEALRRYPPAPFGMPRVVPKGGAVIAGHAVPEDVRHVTYGFDPLVWRQRR